MNREREDAPLPSLFMRELGGFELSFWRRSEPPHPISIINCIFFAHRSLSPFDLNERIFKWTSNLGTSGVFCLEFEITNKSHPLSPYSHLFLIGNYVLLFDKIQRTRFSIIFSFHRMNPIFSDEPLTVLKLRNRRWSSFGPNHSISIKPEEFVRFLSHKQQQQQILHLRIFAVTSQDWNALAQARWEHYAFFAAFQCVWIGGKQKIKLLSPIVQQQESECAFSSSYSGRNVNDCGDFLASTHSYILSLSVYPFFINSSSSSSLIWSDIKVKTSLHDSNVRH